MSRPTLPMLFVAILIGLVLGGCSVNPTYTVHVFNDSSKSINARIEHHRRFDTVVVLESIIVKPGQDRTLGPVESPPLERVLLLVGGSNDTVTTPETFVIKRGSYTARVSRGASTSWSAFDVSLIKD